MNTTTPPTPAAQAPAAKRADYLKSYPTALELAGVAALLAKHGTPAAHAASEALDLLEACEAALAIRAEQRASYKAGLPTCEPPEPANATPVRLDEMLRLVVGGKSVGDRRAKYRKFLRWYVPEINNLEGKPAPSFEEIEEIIERHRTLGIPEPFRETIVAAFRRWLAEQPKESARHAASAKWAQKRRRKTVSPKLREAIEAAEDLT